MDKIRAIADSNLSGFAGGGLRIGGIGDIIGKIQGSGGNGGQLPGGIGDIIGKIQGLGSNGGQPPGGVGNITGKTPGFRKFIVHF